ncbi:hypothetical protein EVAR_102261_1 [Eumeta japonica]|uniref:Uncharacterized protein n=1 Tax=Eumeta variegata TaxID=151549 RepID=A0A4C1ZRM4_EUMVA|nr:hypothetical protein EVAR_102261_1 [Eumeta japonica]
MHSCVLISMAKNGSKCTLTGKLWTNDFECAETKNRSLAMERDEEGALCLVVCYFADDESDSDDDDDDDDDEDDETTEPTLTSARFRLVST